MFQLSKWYLDLTTSDGIAVICYSARLRWGPVRLRHAAVLLAVPGAKTEAAFSVRQVERPTVAGDVLRWCARSLDLRGQWHRRRSAIRATLVRGPAGAIRWSSRMPLAAAEIEWGGRRFTGLGYVESMGMTISPTRLPFRTLRWGRHLSRDHSLVWIDWEGEAPGQWIWLDGVRQHGVTFGEDGTVRLSADRRLQLYDSRDIRNEAVLPTMVTALPGIASRATGSLRTLHEHKMVARSAIHDGPVPLDSGWTVHEVVAW